MVQVTFIAAFVAGLVSFLSPCVLPLIPAFLGYLAGTREVSRRQLVIHAFLFVLGFSSVFALLGVLLSTLITSTAGIVQLWLSRVAGTIIIMFGLYLTGLLHLSFFDREHKFKVVRLGNKHLTSFVFGAAFAVGWTPCVSAVLGSILALAVSSAASAFGLLLAYGIGLGIPFLLAGAFADRFVLFAQKVQGFLRYFNVVVGIVLIVLGILVFTQKLNYIANLFFFGWLL